MVGQVAAALVDRSLTVSRVGSWPRPPEAEKTFPVFLVCSDAHDLAFLAAHELQQRLGFLPALILPSIGSIVL